MEKFINLDYIEVCDESGNVVRKGTGSYENPRPLKNKNKSKNKIKSKNILDHFENKFWPAYPRKVGKKKCRQWFITHQPDEELVCVMLAAIEQQKQSKQWQKDGGKWIPHPLTWLNGERWTDELEPAAGQQSSVFDRAKEKAERNEQ